MSDVQIAVLPTGSGSRSVPRRVFRRAGTHPWVQILAFGVLALYGALRWGTLLSGGSTDRLLALVALATLVAAGGPVVAERSRLLAVLGAVLTAVAALAIAGIPVSWIVNLRVAVTARAIGDGLSALPAVNVPYGGVDQWVGLTILLGAAVLLLTGALVFTFVPGERGYLRLAGAALPLLTLAVIPTTILRPALPYVEGVLLFVLLVVFLWGDQMGRNRLAGVLLPCGLAVTAALIIGPPLDQHQPWINYRSLATDLAPGSVETFDWTQRYGPIGWPHKRQEVLEVQAARPEYWKAQNLDVFDGLGWTAAQTSVATPWQAGISLSALRRWTQTLQVTVRSMASYNVIAAGSAQRPTDLPGGTEGDVSPGTWLAGNRLEPGASYRVKVYSPHPTAQQMAAAGTSYPRSLQLAYLSLEVPEARVNQQVSCGTAGNDGIVAYTPGSGYLVRCNFAPFGAPPGVQAPAILAATRAAGSDVAETMRTSPYAGAFALAQRLARGAATPYSYVERVLRFLGHGFTYNQHPPTSTYPLESFLESTRLGYCQHFAGAMALLLRMGGVPARVAVGFTTGTYDSSLHHYTVIDTDAHAWVEAWFPHYGWVRFDPTPRADPALGGHRAQQSPAAGLDLPAKARSLGVGNRNRLTTPGHAAASRRAAGATSDTAAEVVAPMAVLGLLIVLALLTLARTEGDPVAELGRAFARAGRPLRTDVTLAAVEQWLARTPDAAAYVRSLRLARFASQTEPLSLRGRRALRRALADGLGVTGRVRALWALPPRWQPPPSWRRLNWGHGRRVRALPARDGLAGGGAQPSGHDSADPRA